MQKSRNRRIEWWLEKGRALSVPKNAGPRDLYNTILVRAVVEAARFWGGQVLVLVSGIPGPGGEKIRIQNFGDSQSA
jgi:hypothetical protein